MVTGATGRGPYSTGTRRKAEILAAAVRVFGAKGYGASTLKEIADEVGVSTAAVLRYFSKEELLTEVLRYWDDHQPLLEETSAGLSVFRGFASLMRFHLRNRGFLELYLTFLTEATDPRHPAHEFLIDRHRRTIALLRANLVAAIGLNEIPTMSEAALDYEASAYCAMVDGFEIQWLLNPDVDLVGLVDTYTAQAIQRWRLPTAQPRRFEHVSQPGI